jgi:LysW-gamma-L-lysine carboxypeptidase
VDAKGALAAFTDAVAATGPRSGWQLVVIGAVGEEGDSPGARYVAPRYRPAYAIVGEPSSWQRLTLGYKGSAWAELTVRRSLAHTASRNESACEAAVGAWEALVQWAAAFNAGRERAFDQVLLTLRGMDSGGDGFEEWARLRLGTRLPLDLPPEKWYPQLGRIPGIADTPGLTLEPTGFPLPAFQGGKNTSLVRAFLAGIRAAGGQPGFNLKTGTSDMNLVAPLWGCPALAYGPGDSALDHTPEEHLPLDEYRRAVNVLQAVLERLCAES